MPNLISKAAAIVGGVKTETPVPVKSEAKGSAKGGRKSKIEVMLETLKAASPEELEVLRGVLAVPVQPVTKSGSKPVSGAGCRAATDGDVADPTTGHRVKDGKTFCGCFGSDAKAKSVIKGLVFHSEHSDKRALAENKLRRAVHPEVLRKAASVLSAQRARMIKAKTPELAWTGDKPSMLVRLATEALRAEAAKSVKSAS